LLPYLQRHRNSVFQQDNARPHIARVTQRVLMTITSIHCHGLQPARSPDLSPTEHVWDMIDRRVEDFPAPIGTLAVLRIINFLTSFLSTHFFEIVIIHCFTQSQIVTKISSSYDHPYPFCSAFFGNQCSFPGIDLILLFLSTVYYVKDAVVD
jgi:hypothetical protein